MNRSLSVSLLGAIVLGSIALDANAQDYRLKVVAQTGAGLTSIDPEVALNDRGEIAFTGIDASGSGVFVVRHGVVTRIATAVGGRQYTGVAINDAPVALVAARDRDPGVPQVFRIRTWPADGSMVPTLIGASQGTFNSCTNFVDIDDAGEVTFSGLINNSSQTALFAGTALPPLQLAQWNLNIPIRPQIAESGRIVVRDNVDRILTFPFPSTAPEFVAGPANGFATTGRMPGIARDGRVVAFVGTRNGEGAFVAIRDTLGVWQIARAAGEGTDAFSDFDQDQRICVRASGDLFSGMTITVLFGGVRSGASGAYSVELSAIESGGNVLTAAAPAKAVARIGDVASGKTIASTWLYDSLNRHGVVALLAGFSDGSAGVVRAMGDRDGDGLADVWESRGLDIDDDGTLDLDLPGLGSSPDHKDVFVEVDAMLGFAPSQQVLDRVAFAFANAPNAFVQNPDGLPGIHLHEVLDEIDLPVAGWPFLTPPGWPIDFDAQKQSSFGTANERASSNWTNIRAAKAEVFRYCVFAQSFGSNAAGGVAEGGPGSAGNDLIVSLGHPLWPTQGGTDDEKAGTFMHELGHTLGLGHGGVDSVNHKPNYISVMNYAWQMPDIANAFQWELEFSSNTLPPQNEAALDETVGLGGDPYLAVSYGPPPTKLCMQSGPVDWNRDHDPLDVGVVADITQIDASVASTPGEVLLGWTDWSSLVYDFRDFPAAFDGVHPSSGTQDEMTAVEHAARLATAPEPGSYCTAKTNSLGCAAEISSVGSATLSGADDFVISAAPMRNRKAGVLLWGLKADSQPFAGGTLCVDAPIKRVPLLDSGGSANGDDCTGSYTQPITHADMQLHGWSPGTQVCVQFIGRDPGFAAPESLALSDALVFVVGP